MKVTYNITHSFKDKNGQQHTMTSQLYQTGIYVIFNNDASLQGSSTPLKIKKLQNKLRRDERAGLITDLTFGPKITVSNDSGLWKEAVERDSIFIKEGNTYKCKSPNTGNIYLFTVTELSIRDEPNDCILTFSSDPECQELSMFKISDNTFRANVYNFQKSITSKQNTTKSDTNERMVSKNKRFCKDCTKFPDYFRENPNERWLCPFPAYSHMAADDDATGCICFSEKK